LLKSEYKLLAESTPTYPDTAGLAPTSRLDNKAGVPVVSIFPNLLHPTFY